jgi:hypothetical protein
MGYGCKYLTASAKKLKGTRSDGDFSIVKEGKTGTSEAGTTSIVKAGTSSIVASAEISSVGTGAGTFNVAADRWAGISSVGERLI